MSRTLNKDATKAISEILKIIGNSAKTWDGKKSPNKPLEKQEAK
jgi:hypothetical protein